MRIVRYGLLAGAAIFGLLVAARAVLGPLSFPVPVRTPMNIESFCGLFLMLALAIRMGADLPGFSKPSAVPLISMATLGLLVALAFWRAIGIYFLADDFILVTYARGFHVSAIRPILTTGGGDGFFRPLGYMFLAVIAAWAKFDPRLWHISALVLHALNSVLVAVLASRLGLSRLPAWFAGALFAIHGCLPESTVWIAGRFDLLSTFLVLAGLLFFLEYLKDGESLRSRSCAAASVLCVALALLSKEEAYVYPFLAVLLVAPRRDLWRKASGLLVLFLFVASIFFVYRWILQGGIGGYTDLKSGAPLFAELGAVQAVRTLLLRLWAVLFFPINWSLQPGIFLGVALAGYVAALVWTFGQRTGTLPLIFPLGTVVVASLPPLHQLLIGADLQKSRLLYLPLVGFALMIATAVEPLGRRARWIAPSTILLFHFVALQHNLTAWQRTGEVARETCAAAAECVMPHAGKLEVWNMPGSLDGVYFLSGGFKECLKMQLGSGAPEIELHSGDPAPNQADTALFLWDKVNLRAHCER